MIKSPQVGTGMVLVLGCWYGVGVARMRMSVCVLVCVYILFIVCFSCTIILFLFLRQAPDETISSITYCGETVARHKMMAHATQNTQAHLSSILLPLKDIYVKGVQNSISTNMVSGITDFENLTHGGYSPHVPFNNDARQIRELLDGNGEACLMPVDTWEWYKLHMGQIRSAGTLGQQKAAHKTFLEPGGGGVRWGTNHWA